MTTTHPIILHHFRESPFSEKVRVVFGKNIAWTSVLISRIMPRPDLMPLTGGYRRTPVMQIGAELRHPVYHPRAGAAFPRADAVSGWRRGYCLGNGDVDRSLVLPEYRESRIRLAGR
jgi:hypothetical protein